MRGKLTDIGKFYADALLEDAVVSGYVSLYEMIAVFAIFDAVFVVFFAGML